MQKFLLMASAIEAFLLLVLMGYGPLYLHEELHAGYFVSSQAAALPALATFAGSTIWGQMARRIGLSRLAIVGILGYLGLGLAIFAARSPDTYIAGVVSFTLFSSALAPATLAFLTEAGGNMGRRLATRLQWQSSGWVTGGILGGYLYNFSSHSYRDLLLVLAGLLIIPLAGIFRERPSIPMPRFKADSRQANVHHVLLVLLVLPFFLAYSGNEGFFTNFGLYLRVIHVPVAWVGWSAAMSTGLGWLLASRIGGWADRFGGKVVLTWVLSVYLTMYLIMSLAPTPMIVVGAFSLPLYPLLNIGVQRAVAESTPGENHGAAMGLINGASGLATFGGGLLIGGVDAILGPQGMPWTAAFLVGLGLGAALFIYHGPRRLEG